MNEKGHPKVACSEAARQQSTLLKRINEMDDTDNGSERQQLGKPEKAPEKARKPNGYWTKERCAAAAANFSTRLGFQKGAVSAYCAAQIKGWLDDICGHMGYAGTPAGYWTPEKCAEIAAGFTTRAEFSAAASGAYQAANRLGCLDDVCGHMEWATKPNGYWTKERCAEEATKFDTHTEFALGAPSAYGAARAHGWLHDIRGHMREVLKPMGYWTAARCKESALQFETRFEWRAGAASAYGAAQLRGKLDDCCGHMRPGRACSDGDAVYVWRAVGQIAYGRRLYKPGATSERLGDRRIREVAAKHGFNPVIKALTPVRGCAFELEAKLLQLGKHPHWLEGDGRTEFRALTTAELDLALDMIAQAAA